MSNRVFLWVMLTVLTVCLLLTLAHFVYILYAYQHCSIIQFIAKELW